MIFTNSGTAALVRVVVMAQIKIYMGREGDEQQRESLTHRNLLPICFG
jgi:hypothetical protein